MWTTFLTTDLESTAGIADFTQAILILLGLIGYPMWILYFLFKNQERLPHPSVKANYDSVYQNVDVYRKQAIPHVSFFLARRLLFGAVLVFGGSSIVL